MVVANSHMPCHAALCCSLEKSFSEWHGHGMARVNQTWQQCVNQTGKTQSKPLMARHGMAGEWYGMCELAYMVISYSCKPRVCHTVQGNISKN
jgi:hypothetical protein